MDMLCTQIMIKKNKWQTPSKLPWATRGDLGDWITLNYPKPLCRCKSRCEKTNYCFQLVHTAESSQRAKPGERRTQPAFQPAKATYFPQTHVLQAVPCHTTEALIQRELWTFMRPNITRCQQARPRLAEGVKWLIFHLQVNEAFWWMLSVKRASVMP